MPEGTCREDGCDKPVASRERCENHYRKFLRDGGARVRGRPALDRGPYAGCWEWRGSRLPKGYGTSHMAAGGYVHRAVYEAIYGPFDPALFVCHKCDNPPCFRPDHLFLGTPLDNMRDMAAKGRSGGELRRKLTDAQLDEIRSLYLDGVSPTPIARRFMVSTDYVCALLSGRERGGPDLVSARRQARTDRDADICAAWLAGAAPLDLAPKYGLTPGQIRYILKRAGHVLHPRRFAA